MFSFLIKSRHNVTLQKFVKAINFPILAHYQVKVAHFLDITNKLIFKWLGSQIYHISFVFIILLYLIFVDVLNIHPRVNVLNL